VCVSVCSESVQVREYVFVCEYMIVSVCDCVCVCTCVRACVRAYVCACACVCVRECVRLCVRACESACVYACARLRVFVRACVVHLVSGRARPQAC